MKNEFQVHFHAKFHTNLAVYAIEEFIISLRLLRESNRFIFTGHVLQLTFLDEKDSIVLRLCARQHFIEKVAEQ